MSRLTALRERLRQGLWAVPAFCVVLAVLLALALVQVDRVLQEDVAFGFGAGADGAREVLGAITTAMITFTGLVFSITVVVLQLTSSQFSPRVLRTFLRDRQTQWALGVFTATFVYAVMVLRTVRTGETGAEQFVPGLATAMALVLLLVSVGLFVGYIHHIATAIQVSSIIAAIGGETREALERRHPSGRDEPVDAVGVLPPDDLPSAQLPAPRSGVLVAVDEAALVAAARTAGAVLRTAVHLGDYVPAGAPLLEVLGPADGLDLDAVHAAVVQDRDRRLEADVAFGLRQLVDIAERALSPGINDPTTAVQALDELHDLLRRLVTRPLRTGVHTDRDGHVRLVLPPDRFADYLELALDEVLQYGADAKQVQQRADALLRDLASAALPQHRDDVLRYQARRDRERTAP